MFTIEQQIPNECMSKSANKKASRFKNHNFVIVLFVVLFTIGISAYLTFHDSAEEQGRMQQQLLSPTFDLLAEELLKPVHIAEAIAESDSVLSLMSRPVIDHQAVIDKLSELKHDFNLEFFIASETSLKQYNSDGSWFALDEEEVNWYFHARAKQQKVTAALGKREDTTIYFDLKVFSDTGEFLGFIGVAKPLHVFLSAFEQYRTSFGYDFVFVDENQNVTLASDPSLLNDGKKVISLQQLNWYRALSTEQKKLDTFHDIVVNTAVQPYLIGEVELSTFNWKLFLLTPLVSRQQVISDILLSNNYVKIILILIALIVAHLLVNFFRKEKEIKPRFDALTNLPTKDHLSQGIDKIIRANQSLSLIFVDIDNLEHQEASDILLIVAKLLQTELREQDTLYRWNDEGFAIMLPKTDMKIAQQFSEKVRAQIAHHQIVIDDRLMAVTVSIGLTYSNGSESLKRVISYADEALYQAKKDGRNTVRMQSIEVA